MRKGFNRRALLLGGATTFLAGAVFAASGQPMMYPLPDATANMDLARYIGASLRRDPNGNAWIEGSPCSTPKDFFDAIVAWHPNVGLDSVADLPGFLRSLIRRKARAAGFTGRYVMSRMLCSRVAGPNASGKLDLSGEWTREFRPDEYAWFHPNHDAPILAGDCGNVVKPEAPEAEEQCVTLSFKVPIGTKVRWGVGTRERPLKPHACNAIKQGNGEWLAWNGECDVCVPATGFIRSLLGGQAVIPHRFLYEAIAEEQTIRFSTEVWQTVVYICLEYPNGVQTCGVYMRPEDWKGRYHVDIPPELFVADNGNCPR